MSLSSLFLSVDSGVSVFSLRSALVTSDDCFYVAFSCDADDST